MARAADDQRTPLHLAASEGMLEVVAFLLDRGVHVNPTDRWGATPLQDALRHKHTECAIALLNHGGVQGSELSSHSRGNHRVLHAAAAAATGNVTLLDMYINQPGNSVDDRDCKAPPREPCAHFSQLWALADYWASWRMMGG
eukprot:3597876-Prymnesium_polylepis.1